MKDLANLFQKAGIKPMEFKKKRKDETSKFDKILNTSDDLRRFLKNKRYCEEHTEKINVRFGYNF